MSRKDRAQGQGQYTAGTFRCQGAGRPWASLLRRHPSPARALTLVRALPALCPRKAWGPHSSVRLQPGHTAGPFPPGCISRKSVGAKETFAKKERPRGPGLVTPAMPALWGCGRRGPQAAT